MPRGLVSTAAATSAAFSAAAGTPTPTIPSTTTAED